MAEFNLFGNATKDQIRVAYISTERGLVDNVTVCEANDYAKLNPGTQFIFRNREFTKYMNINGVNKLTPDDMTPKQQCDGIEMTKECGPPQVFFSGGDGVGIKANPIIGQDGSIMAIDLVSGGFGFQQPPNVQVKDNCGIGAGGNFKAELGEIAEQWEYYDLEEDFEEYEICEGASDTGVFGRRYGVNGEDLGVWEPKLYANFKNDPIRKEIIKYQKILAKGTNPFWTTRSQAPLSLTGEKGTTRRVYNVDHSAWGDFMNKNAVSPKPKSNASGSDFAGIPYSFVWEEDFPYDGEYVFKAQCDNKAELYFDNVPLSNFKIGFGGAAGHTLSAPESVKKTIKAGVHQIRVDLVNFPIKEEVIEQQKTEEEVQVAGVDFVKKAKGYYMIVGGNDDVEVSLQLYWKDNPNTAGTAITKVTIPNPGGENLVLERAKSGDSWSHKGSSSQKSVFKTNELGYGPIQFEGNVKEPILQNKNLAYGSESTKFGELKFIDNHGNDTNGRLSIISAKNLQESRTKKVKPSKSTKSQDMKLHKVFNTIDYIDKANRPLWRTNVYNRGGFINEYGISPFDTTVTLDDNPYAGTHTITWSNVTFPIDGNYDIGIQVDDNVTLHIEDNTRGTKETIRKIGFAGDTDTSTGKSNYIRNFLKGTYTITAELEQIPGGKFGYEGVKGINPMALAINIETVFTVKQVISAKSWNENPMGIALTIDAPDPPVPQEQIPEALGRCPRNPMWSTRHPNADKKWFPVRIEGWSQFLNRYAMSPVPPRADVGSDAGGSVFTNSWQQEIPYSGWYKIKAEVDDICRIYINGEKQLDLSRRIDKIRGEKKFFLPKGETEIKIEVENYDTTVYETIDKKIFSTTDWAVTKKQTIGGGSKSIDIPYVGLHPANKPIRVTSEGKKIELKDGHGNDANASFTITSGDVKFSADGKKIEGSGSATLVLSWNDNPSTAGVAIESITLSGKTWTRTGRSGSQTHVIDIGSGSVEVAGSTAGGTAKDGVTYDGPELATYTSGDLGAALTPKWDFTGDSDIDNDNYRQNYMDKTWTSTWSNVEFPEDGQYQIQCTVDDTLSVKLDGVEIANAKILENVPGSGAFNEAEYLKYGKTNVKTITFNAIKGKRTLSATYTNIPGNQDSTFYTNPVHFSFKITRKVSVGTGSSRSWTDNPIGISAVLIPPPCPKKISGKGTVTRVIVDDPGNGFPKPGGDGYPVGLGLSAINIKDCGINYDCSKDRLVIEPSNGASAELVCDNFGRISKVVVTDPGLGFTKWPSIRIERAPGVRPPDDQPTGVNFEATPVFEVIRDPIVVNRDKLLQVTDLVGVKQTGYYEGRPYYGAVFYKNNIRYAGWYETPGELVQIYDTLQESIDAQVTTPQSAILRQGSDSSSNDPKLNLPGTPENLT